MAAVGQYALPFDDKGNPNYTHNMHLTKEGRIEQMQESQPTPEFQTEIPEEQQKSLEERWKAMIEDLVYNHGMSPRKARRYLESEARRNTRRMIRAGRRRQKQLAKEGKLVDTSDLRAQLDAELAQQLSELEEQDKQQQQLTVDIETDNYTPPTEDF